MLSSELLLIQYVLRTSGGTQANFGLIAVDSSVSTAQNKHSHFDF